MDQQAIERRLGYHFGEAALLRQALTHPSFVQSGGPDNQRLEYLGDAVLQLCVSRRLFDLFPGEGEGQLSRRRASLVREESLAEAARGLSLGPALSLGHGEETTGGRQKPSVLADALEAVIAAVYLDGGLEAAQALVDKVVGDYTASLSVQRDAKTALQEALQALGYPTPTYRQVERSGPDHAPVFTSEVLIGEKALARGSGGSKKTSEQAAAEAALEGLRENQQEG